VNQDPQPWVKVPALGTYCYTQHSRNKNDQNLTNAFMKYRYRYLTVLMCGTVKILIIHTGTGQGTGTVSKTGASVRIFLCSKFHKFGDFFSSHRMSTTAFLAIQYRYALQRTVHRYQVHFRQK
jgi:hypothetical protein